MRHARRYGLPSEDRHASARTWLLTGGTSPRLDRGLGLRRARAAILLMLVRRSDSGPVTGPQLPADTTAWLISG